MAGLSKGVGAAKLFSMLEMNKHLKVGGGELGVKDPATATIPGCEALLLLSPPLHFSPPSGGVAPPQ